MIEGLLGLLACQLVGEVLVRALHLRIPGPVLGMLVLLLLLSLRPPGDDHPVVRAGTRVLDELPLLFVPAGVGIVTVLPLLRHSWLPVSVALVGSWGVGLLATAWSARLVTGRATDPSDAEAHQLVHEADRIEGLEDDEGDAS